ncbi:TonB-dependent receptor [Asticcacaulis solisilvae]|uniref:TonB-dependent receptor n=1 Tax=Asticcacaulis solisilvae TaxID=1217274 RepID=UPI003FD7E0FA
MSNFSHSGRTLRIALMCATALTAAVAGVARAEDAQATQTAATPADQAAKPAAAQAPATAPADSQVVVVTGYRGSLQNSTVAKKRAVRFEDSIYAEDMGKFPDTNLAESFNRIPGITIAREIDGEGTTIAIRGLGSSFTRVLLNGAAVAVASTGDVNTSDTNREVDLDLFPPELFTQLTVTKTASANMLEGGAAGTVNMRQARPFDTKGDRLQYSFQGMKNSLADNTGYKGSLMFSKKWGNFGVLVGVAKQKSYINVDGYETVGWTNPNLSATQSTSAARNGTGGGNWTIPGTVPANAGNGLTTGATIDQAFLLAHNPGLTIDQIDNGIIPRLGRPMHYYGDRDRTSAVLSFEWRPSDTFHAWLDTMSAVKENNQKRTDIDFVGRNGSAIPLNMKVDKTDCSNGCTVTQATYANAQFFLEYRPFIEKTKFTSLNPGFTWKLRDDLTWNLDANYTISHFRRDSPTVLVITAPNSGLTATYTNTNGMPMFTSNVDLNNPANFQWDGGRVNIQSEERQTQTRGLHTSIKWGDSAFSIEAGFAYDDTSRKITPYDNSQFWQNAVCGNNPSVQLPGPNGQPACKGAVITNTAAAQAAGYPAYPGYGTNYTAGGAPVTWGGSLIPQSSLANYLTPGPYGYIDINWDKFAADSQYYKYLGSAPVAGSSNISSPRSFLREKVQGAYIQFAGNRDVFGRSLRYDFGIRAVTTDQIIAGQNSFPDPRNTSTVLDGGKYPNLTVFSYTEAHYKDYLPSLNAAYSLTDNFIARLAASTTMTRPNPSSMLPGLSFGDPSAAQGSLGNPALTSYLSKNFDFGLEYYTGKEGYIALTTFQKKLTGFTLNQNITYPFSYLAQYGVTYDTLNATQQAAINLRGGPNAATVVLSQPVNASGLLTINGLEFSWVQPLDKLWAPLDGFGYSTNYTYIKQKGTGAAPGIALGVPKVTWNFTGFYEKGGWSVRLSDTYRDGSQATLNNQNGITNAVLFNEKYEQLDFSASVDLQKAFGFSRNIELTLDGTNLGNSTLRQDFQFTNAPNWYYKPGTTWMLGVRGKF